MKVKTLLATVIIMICSFITVTIVRADECDNISGLSYNQAGSCISKLQGISDAIAKANATSTFNTSGSDFCRK